MKLSKIPKKAIKWVGEQTSDGLHDAKAWTVVLTDGSTEVIVDRSTIEDSTYQLLPELQDTM